MRELREFREAHDDYAAAGIRVAGVNGDSPAGNAWWTRRMRLPFPLLSDPDRGVARAFGAVRELGIGGWTLALARRRTVVAGYDGVIEGVWDKVRIRGHAAEVLRAARGLGRSGATGRSS